MCRRVGPEDWTDWRLLRQRSLREDPQAFASSITMWTGDRDTEARWRARLATPDSCFLAYADGTPVGMIAGISSEGSAELISMWVAPEVRGSGVGRGLVQAVIAWSDGRPLHLRVVDGNAAAVTLYESQGFVMDPACADAEGCRRMALTEMIEEPL